MGFNSGFKGLNFSVFDSVRIAFLQNRDDRLATSVISCFEFAAGKVEVVKKHFLYPILLVNV